MSRRPSVVTLYASEIGCILEKNPFCSRTEILKCVWYRMAGECTSLSCHPNLDRLKMVSQTKPGRAFKDQKYDIKDHTQFDDIVISLKKRSIQQRSQGFGGRSSEFRSYRNCRRNCRESSRNREMSIIATTFFQFSVVFKRSYGTSEDIGTHRLSRRKWDGSGIKTRV